MIVDFFYWTKAQVDDKFLQDMILICDRQITDPAAEVALRNCKQNGGFYQEAPTVAGTWAPPVTGGMSAWSIGQKGRLVTATWTGGSAWIHRFAWALLLVRAVRPLPGRDSARPPQRQGLHPAGALHARTAGTGHRPARHGPNPS